MPFARTQELVDELILDLSTSNDRYVKGQAQVIDLRNPTFEFELMYKGEAYCITVTKAKGRNV